MNRYIVNAARWVFVVEASNYSHAAHRAARRLHPDRRPLAVKRETHEKHRPGYFAALADGVPLSRFHLRRHD